MSPVVIVTVLISDILFAQYGVFVCDSGKDKGNSSGRSQGFKEEIDIAV